MVMSPARTILVVDDEEDIRAVLSARLEAAGFQVRSAARGLEALESIRSDPPSLVVLDLMLPDLDGLSVCAMVKRDRGLRCIPVILLTAKSRSEDRITGMALGADAYLNKPFKAEELLAEVRRLMPECEQTGV